jgi:DNA-binding SARP family transcriptional activator
MEAIWPETNPENAWHNLRMCASRLRRALDPYYDGKGVSYIDYDNEHYRLNLPDGSIVDVLEFKRLCSNSRSPGTLTTPRMEHPKQELCAIISLYHGEYLPKERYKPIIEELRLELETQHQRVCLAYSDQLLASGDNREAIKVLEKGLRFDPLWHDGVKLLMEARVKSGDLYRALRIYREYEQRVQKELDLPPDAELRQYFESLVRL